MDHEETLEVLDALLRDEELAGVHEEIRKVQSAVKKLSLVTRADCVGCHNSCYHGQLADECWSFASAKLVPLVLVPSDQAPPYTQPSKKLPSCYRQKGYVTMSETERRQINARCP